MTKKKVASLDIVIPVFNECPNILRIYNEICQTFNGALVSIRIIYIDDGSTDKSWQMIEQLPKTHVLEKQGKRKEEKSWGTKIEVRGIRLTRNFGQFIAIEEGLKASNADYVLIMDCDLQHPPKVALELWNSRLTAPTIGTHQVLRHERLVKSWLSTFFYTLLRILSGKKFPKNVSDFRIMDRETKESILETSHSVKVPRFVIVNLGIEQKLINYTPLRRENGTSKYTFQSMSRLAGYAILSSSSRLLRFGLFSALIYFVFIIFLFMYMVMLVMTSNFTPGWVSLMGTMLFSFMLNFVLLGVLGSFFAEYVLNNGRHKNRIRQQG